MGINSRTGNTLLSTGFFPPCRIATTGANIALAGLPVLDGVQLKDGDRVLVKNQAAAWQNGIYAASSGNWQRTADARDNGHFLAGMSIIVSSGTINRGTVWRCTSADDPVIVGASDITWGPLSVIIPVAVPAGGRIRLLAPTTFYVARDGSDVTGDGSASNPWATRTHAYLHLQQNYDLGGQTVTVQCGDTDVLGPYTDNFGMFGPILGQSGALGLRFFGNLDDPSKCVIRPTAGYSWGVAFDAAFSVAGFKSDHSAGNGQCDGTGPGDMFTAGQGGEIWIINPTPGVMRLMYIFGESAGICYNDMGAAFDGRIFIDTWVKLKIDSTDNIITTTGTWTAGSGTITVASAAGIKVGMHIRGNGIFRNMWVVAIAGNVLTLAGAGTHTSKTNEPVTLVMSRQTHCDVGVRGQVIHNTNGGANLNGIEIAGPQFFYGGFILSNGSGAQASFQTIQFTGDTALCDGMPFVAKTLGSIDTLALTNDPATYLPGFRVTKTVTFGSDVEDLDIGSNGSIPYSGTEVLEGNLVLGGPPGEYFRSPLAGSFGSATGEMTVVDMVKGRYGLGTNAEIRLSRKTLKAGTNVTVTFVGVVGQGGQLN